MADGDIMFYIFTGEDGEDIPLDATHVSAHESVTVIPARAFYRHQNIIEFICHAGVKRIEAYAFHQCPRLKRVVIPGVKVVEAGAFGVCEAIARVECDELERIGESAFYCCKSLESINLLSAKIVEGYAFRNCRAMTDAKFGNNLDSILVLAFDNCLSLEQITIPLKRDLFGNVNVFQACENLTRVDLVDGEALHQTIDALHFKEWADDMNEDIDSINQILPNARSGYSHHPLPRRLSTRTRVSLTQTPPGGYARGEKTQAIREWTAKLLHKIVRYKAEHCLIVEEAANTLQLVTPNDIVMNNVLPFLEIPPHAFDGEESNGEDDNEQ